MRGPYRGFAGGEEGISATHGWRVPFNTRRRRRCAILGGMDHPQPEQTPAVSFEVTPFGERFACAVHGLDLRDATPAVADAAARVMDRYGVCVIRDQQIADTQQIAFSRLFGALEHSPHFGRRSDQTLRMRFAELFDVSNLDENDDILEDNDRRRAYRAANLMWHTDSSFQPGGAGYSLLSARVVPPSGADTEFADMRAAYDDLPAATQARLDGLVVEHSTAYSRSLVGYRFSADELQRCKVTRQYLVQTHPRTGRRSLYLASHASHIVGLDLQEGRALLAELVAFATRPAYRYVHRWQVGDLLMWDNRCTMHRATPFDDFAHKRDLRRTTVVGDLPLVPA
jgi:alpha-ketoglutarate-dependent 2,4-dichlorophenoxyacetate dioxygenase